MMRHVVRRWKNDVAAHRRIVGRGAELLGHVGSHLDEQWTLILDVWA